NRIRTAVMGRQFLEPFMYGGIAGPAAGPVLPRPETKELVADDREQPAAERPAFGVIVQPLDGLRHDAQRLLHQVGRVSILHTLFAREAVDQRAVDLHELRPGLMILTVAETHQQAWAGAWRIGHRDGLSSKCR